MSAKATEKPTEVVESLFEKAISNPDTIARVSQFVKTGKRWDSTHKDHVGVLIIIKSYKTIRTKYGDAALVKLDTKGEQHDVLFGSEVLQEQLKELEPNLPVLAQIQKPGRSYLLFDPTDEMIERYKSDYL
jgi:hypothetical protein